MIVNLVLQIQISVIMFHSQRKTLLNENESEVSLRLDIFEFSIITELDFFSSSSVLSVENENDVVFINILF